jgi:beta-lactamase regulating signal transducer with metallopeptidase domain
MAWPDLLGSPLMHFLAWLGRASVAATIIAGIVLLVQLLFGRWLTPAWRHRLWWLVALRLLLPALPASAMSLWNFDPSDRIRDVLARANAPRPDVDQPLLRMEPISSRPEVIVSYSAPPLLPSHVARATATVVPPSVHPSRPQWPVAIALFWAAVVLLLLTRLAAANVLLARRLRRAHSVTDPLLLGRFAECCRLAGVSPAPALMMTDAVRVPSAAGVWRHRVLLPPGLFERLSEQEQRSVLLHELAHVRCRDVASNWIQALVRILHWFNPAIRLALARMKADREIARDAMVLRSIASDQSSGAAEQYARTLLNLTESLSFARRCPGMAAGLAGICSPPASVSQLFGSRSGLKRRIKMIGNFHKCSARSSLPGLLLAVSLASCTLTRAQNPAQGSTPPKPPLAASAASQPDRTLSLAGAINEAKEVKRDDASHKEPDEALQKKLDLMIPELNFNAQRLSDVIDFLRDLSEANIFVNWKSLEAAGIERDTPVTARFRNIRFGKLLSIVLDSVGGGHRKAAYATDEGVITISTVADLSKNVAVRVYDIRDLLAIPLDYVAPQLAGGLRGPATMPTTAPASPASPTREELVKLLIKLIEDTVATPTWQDRGGSAGALRELQGQLIVTQTPENHVQIVELLDQLRAARNLQCEVDAQFISCDEPVARVLLEKWQKIAPPATRSATAGKATTASPSSGIEPSDHASAAVGLFLDDAQVKQFLHAGQDAPGFAVIAAPRMRLFNGQRAYVMAATSRAYTSDYAAVKAAGGQTRYDLVVSVVQTGLLMDVQATISADRTAATLTLHPQVSALLGMKQFPWRGNPAGLNLMVQEPQVRSAELQTTVSVPDGRTLLLGGMEDPRVPDDPAAATRPDRPLRSLFLLVKPKLIAGVGEQQQFPLLTHSKDR